MCSGNFSRHLLLAVVKHDVSRSFDRTKNYRQISNITVLDHPPYSLPKSQKYHARGVLGYTKAIQRELTRMLKSISKEELQHCFVQ
ncbi:hypothetical protein WH47_07214 [Habropoda laboriosa]|uniref:Uncharacterized protein n=1 Tax=Habropoda laboriosa TaxID=597456 RepID=A0A0L7RJM0_9HYME|nr:hypothetical protein WH47_07214 [Habropoda laboriosa]